MLELSENSASASSGRGSAEDEEEDEELRMINEGSLHNRGATSPSSGSGSVAPNTAEYLARLGIAPLSRSSRGGPPSSTGHHSSIYSVGGGDNHPSPMSSKAALNNQSLYLFQEQEGGIPADLVSNLLLHPPPAAPSSVMTSTSSSRRLHPPPPPPSVNGTHTHPAVTHVMGRNDEEISGSYNWDYLHDWGPQYQPLAHVFSEIARLKDDNSPTSVTSSPSLHKPPPMLTSLPPRTAASVKASQFTSPASSRLPPSLTNGVGLAMSPSFSPALSPLAARSPSISPLVVGHGPRPTPRRGPPSAPASEREMRI